MHIVPRNKHGITGMRRVDQLGELRRNLAISARLGCSAGGGGFQPRLALNPSHQTVLLGRQLANCPRPRNGRENRPHRRRRTETPVVAQSPARALAGSGEINAAQLCARGIRSTRDLPLDKR